jgi:hypothetical protein
MKKKKNHSSCLMSAENHSRVHVSVCWNAVGGRSRGNRCGVWVVHAFKLRLNFALNGAAR